jgi:phosphoketolase
LVARGEPPDGGAIYPKANALLREPLRAEHVKPRLLGHWGTSRGVNLVYAHLNRGAQSLSSTVSNPMPSPTDMMAMP